VDRFLNRIIAWAEAQPDIRAVVMTGSRARDDTSVDAVSDYDLELFTRNPSRYESDEWMAELGEVWVHLPTTSDEHEQYLMRLVVFADAVKVDFGFAPLDLLESAAASGTLTPLYERGYRVLLDKDGVAAGLPAPSFRPPRARLPSADEFRGSVEEFWFEASHIPKLLSRNELWVVKMREWTMKLLLLQMIEWHAVARDPERDVWHIGTRLQEWASPGIWERLPEAFGGFGSSESLRALLATMSLYRDLALETAQRLGHEYQWRADEAVTGYIERYARG
jgi:aminoglycoside 6-adenylyltransferase